MTMRRHSLDKAGALAALFRRYDEELPLASEWGPAHCISPQHVDENMSASANPSAGAYVCHACGIKGDAFAVLQQIENISFKEAKEILSKPSTIENKTSRFDWL